MSVGNALKAGATRPLWSDAPEKEPAAGAFATVLATTSSTRPLPRGVISDAPPGTEPSTEEGEPVEAQAATNVDATATDTAETAGTQIATAGEEEPTRVTDAGEEPTTTRTRVRSRTQTLRPQAAQKAAAAEAASAQGATKAEEAPVAEASARTPRARKSSATLPAPAMARPPAELTNATTSTERSQRRGRRGRGTMRPSAPLDVAIRIKDESPVVRTSAAPTMPVPEPTAVQQNEARYPAQIPTPLELAVAVSTDLAELGAAAANALSKAIPTIVPAPVTGATLPPPAAHPNAQVHEAVMRVVSRSAHAGAAVIEMSHPELGQVRLELAVAQDGMTLRVLAADARAAAALRASEAVLRKSVAAHGIQLRELKIVIDADQRRGGGRRRKKNPHGTVDTEA